MATTPAQPTGHVIAGVDGSASARDAVDWAADEAALRGTTLELLHAWRPKAFERKDWYGELLADAGVELLRANAARARERHPGLTVVTEIVRGHAASVLVEASKRAGLLVLGHRGLGGVDGLHIGSVGLNVAAHAACPLLIARTAAGSSSGAGTPARPRGPVLVGLADASCAPALHAACDEAALRGLPVRAVHAWNLPLVPTMAGVPTPFVLPAETVEVDRKQSKGMVDDEAAALHAAYPDLEITADILIGEAGWVLIDASEQASLTVLATHRRPGRLGFALGPVTHALVAHARSAVLLVPVG
ncbi:universal stress protein [Yinghuangia soli]|uniref:Universal stress protein n=1 Tax=Yinghuangia soli TaxID=2908204 RepID=A0AA41QBG5_9ACTN|nr:universal stress protein [Yinghuangia soli]MCF2533829.1 universal stress protein [Yinghuangia soli]